ncbi:MAG: hypothetical protein R3297_11190, partial [Desulfobulbales bacterium]|nr:hypothetical protein [Desulfobulbales bacterium]
PQNPYADPMGWTSGFSTPKGAKRPWGNGDGRFIYPPESTADAHPKEPVLEAFRRFPVDPADKKKLILYENGYHMLLRDLKAENVMKDIVEWLSE